MHPAPALRDTDLSGIDHLGELRYRVAGDLVPAPVGQAVFRSAFGTAYGLMVESSVLDAGVFMSARIAHGEIRHRGLLPVVRQRGEQSEPRSAVGACRERIPFAPSGRSHLLQTVVADGSIGGYTDASAPVLRMDYGETVAVRHRMIDDLQGFDLRQRRKFLQESILEKYRIINVYHDSGAVVPNPPFKSQRHGDPLHGRSETDALHSAPDDDAHETANLYEIIYCCITHGMV